MIDPCVYKAYDIRGLFPDELDEAGARQIGEAFGGFLAGRVPAPSQPGIVVGRDARESSPALATAFIEGALATGIDVLDIGLCTTPMLYFAVNVLGSRGGAMITASHNPARYNGLKLVREKAIPISSATGLLEIRDLAAGGAPRAARRGQKASWEGEVQDRYAQFFRGLFPASPGVEVCIDTGNGAAGAILPRILEEQGVRFHPLFLEPDGRFPNHDPNPLIDANLADLRRGLASHPGAVGVAFDGDGDRVCFLDERGNVVRGDLTTALLARELLGRHPGRPVLYDLRASHVVPETIREAGGEPIRTRVGHAFIKQQMRDVGALFAGELSYHFYFEDFFYCESGILAMLRLLELIGGPRKPLHGLIEPLRRYCHSGELNFAVDEPSKALEATERRFREAHIDHLDGLTIEYSDWWFNLRPSNTEPVVRLNLEADSPEVMERRLHEVSELLARFRKPVA